MKNRIIVLSFPRSGTRSMARKLDLGHEKMNDKGISDWHLVFGYVRRPDDHVIQVMRNPIDVISSNVFTMGFSSLQYIRQMAEIEDKSILSTIVEGYIKWIEQIEKTKPDEIIRIENEEIRVNCRYHPTLKWEDLEGLPDELLNKLKEIAIKYGYNVNG